MLKRRYPEEAPSHVMTHLMDLLLFSEPVPSRALNVRHGVCAFWISSSQVTAGGISLPAAGSHRQRNLGIAPGDDIRLHGPGRRFLGEIGDDDLDAIPSPSHLASSQVDGDLVCVHPAAWHAVSAVMHPAPIRLSAIGRLPLYRPSPVVKLRTRKCGGRQRVFAGRDKLRDPPFRPFFVGERDQGITVEAEGVAS